MNQITAEVPGHFVTGSKLYSLHLVLVTFRCPSSLHRIIYLRTVSHLFNVTKATVLHNKHIKTHQSKNTIPVINLKYTVYSVTKNVSI